MSFPRDVDAWVRLLTLLPILAASIVGSTIALVKWLQLREWRAAGTRMLETVRGLGEGEDARAALAAAAAGGSLAGRLARKALAFDSGSRARLVEHVELEGRQLARTAERGLDTLALLATLGPLLGLFGTVVGIVLVFNRLASAQGIVSPSQLAGGIGTALYTTVAGLIVGMCALVSHRALASRTDDVIDQLETLGQALVDRRGATVP
jgi:biopolymer transport protein ExbB